MKSNRKSDCTDVAESTRKVLYTLTPDSTGISVTRKVPLMQGVVAKIVMQMFLEGPYFALPDEKPFSEIETVGNHFQGEPLFESTKMVPRVFGINVMERLKTGRPP